MERKFMLKKQLSKIWKNDRIEKFYKSIEKHCKLYKIECLEKFIIEIIDGNEKVEEKDLIRYCNNMDAYVSDTEFMIDFFRAIRTPEGDAVAKRIEDDHEEVLRMVEGLKSSGKIEYKESPEEFIVWYK